MSPRASSWCLLSTSRVGDSITSLGNLFQCLTTLPVMIIFFFYEYLVWISPAAICGHSFSSFHLRHGRRDPPPPPFREVYRAMCIKSKGTEFRIFSSYGLILFTVQWKLYLRGKKMPLILYIFMKCSNINNSDTCKIASRMFFRVI